jgi:hypothetical protein
MPGRQFTCRVIAGGMLAASMVRGTAQAAAQNSGAIPATIADAAGTIGTGSVGSLLHQLVVGLLLKHDVELSKVRFVNWCERGCLPGHRCRDRWRRSR